MSFLFKAMLSCLFKELKCVPTIQGNVVLFIQGIKVYALLFKAMLSCLFKELKCVLLFKAAVLFIQGIEVCPTIQGNVVLFIQGIEVCPTIQGNVVLFIQGIKVCAYYSRLLSCLFKELKCVLLF